MFNLSYADVQYQSRPFVHPPGANMVAHGPQSLVADTLPVHRGHVGYLVAHNEVSGRLVAGLVGDGAEGVAEGVEVAMAVDAESTHEPRHLLSDRVVRGVLVPAA